MRHVHLLDVTDDLNEPFGPSFERPTCSEANARCALAAARPKILVIPDITERMGKVLAPLRRVGCHDGSQTGGTHVERRGEQCCATQPDDASCAQHAPCSPLARAYGVPLLRVPAARIVGTVCARGNANSDEPRFSRIGPDWAFYGPPYASAWSFLSLCSRRSSTARGKRHVACLPCAAPGPAAWSGPSARRGVRASVDRYGRNRSVCRDARKLAGHAGQAARWRQVRRYIRRQRGGGGRGQGGGGLSSVQVARKPKSGMNPKEIQK